jgi:hypothetical protein
MPKLTPEQLEARLQALFRDQPPRRAPRSLEQRVLAEITRREALPWWRKSFSFWPAAVQFAFLFVGVGLALGTVAAAILLFSGNSWSLELERVTEPVTNTLLTLRSAGAALVDMVRGWLPPIPTTWVYAFLLMVGAAYAALVGIGATAYRLFWQPR